MKSKYIIGTVVILAVIGLIAVLSSNNKSTKTQEGVKDIVEEQASSQSSAHIATTLSFASLESGQEIAINSFLGKPLIINSWASWCPFCTGELPAFDNVAKNHAGELTIVAVNRRESVQTAQDYLEENGLAQSSMVFLQDPDDILYKTIGGFGMPETLVFNAEGVLLEHKRGPLTESQLEDIISNTLSL